MPTLTLIKSRTAPLPKEKDYLWRYFDIHKFINLLQTKTIRFARMDQFEDPQEGIPLSALITYAEKLNLNLVQNMSLSQLILDESMFNNIPQPLRTKLKVINAIQKTSFLSCWFAGQHESVAMWNLYSNADSVAVKIPFGQLCSQLNVESNLKISAYYAGRVAYQDFKKIYKDPAANSVGKVALRKDTSYSHENEFRFVVRTNNHHNDVAGINSQPLNLSTLNMKVICHPRMAGWKKNNIKNLLDASGLKNALGESEIRMRG
jgi:hypothetical protein